MAHHARLLTAATDLATDTTAERFDGEAHGDGVPVSFFLTHTAPGAGVALHRHPYQEVFVVFSGEVTFTVEGNVTAARGGQVLVVPAGAVHAFRNTGSEPLEMITIHPVAAMVTEWVGEESAAG